MEELALRDVLPGLQPGERVLWSGGPDPNVWLSRGDLVLIPLTVLALIASVVWSRGLLPITGPWGAVVVIPVIAFALYVTFGRFLYKRWMKRRTSYRLTTDRVLVLVDGAIALESQFDRRSIEVRRSSKRSHATIVFHRGSLWFVGPGWNGNTGLEPLMFGRRPVAFYDVADAGPLLEQIGRLKRSLT